MVLNKSVCRSSFLVCLVLCNYYFSFLDGSFQQVHVYYKGTLAKNKKQFDACLSGQPFSFRVGAGQVIQGWDQGVTGKCSNIHTAKAVLLSL